MMSEMANGLSACFKLLTFEIGGRKFAMDIRRVQQIVEPAQKVRPSGLPGPFESNFTLGGRSIPLVNLGMSSKIRGEQSGSERVIILVDGDGGTFGLTVDSVAQVVKISDGKFETPPTDSAESYPRYVTSAHTTGNEFIRVLDVDRISEDVQRRIGTLRKAEEPALI